IRANAENVPQHDQIQRHAEAAGRHQAAGDVSRGNFRALIAIAFSVQQKGSMNFERRAVLCFAVFCAALIPVLGFGASGETAASSSALDRGYHDAYNLDFTSAQREFAGWEREHPSDPVAPGSSAAGILLGE